MSAAEFGLFTYEVADGEVTITDYPELATGAVVVPSSIGTGGGNGTRLTMPFVPGREIGIEYSPDLSDGSWSDIGDFSEGTGGLIFTETDATRRSKPRGHYRAILRSLG